MMVAVMLKTACGNNNFKPQSGSLLHPSTSSLQEASQRNM